MLGKTWYHKSIKKVIATFATLFSEVVIVTGDNKEVKVPIHFAQKSKLIESMMGNEDVRNMYVDVGLPVFGFEIVNYSYQPEVMTNPLNIQHQRLTSSDDKEFMFTSVPYSIGIELYLLADTMDSMYQVIEQVVPFFTPQLTLKITDKDLYGLTTNITFDLTAVSQDVQYESSFDEKKVISCNFSFIVHTKLHSNPRSLTRIREIIVNMKEKDHDDVFSKLTGTRINGNESFEWKEE